MVPAGARVWGDGASDADRVAEAVSAGEGAFRIPAPEADREVHFGAAPASGDRLPGTAENCRRTGVHTGYTFRHLPLRSCNPPAFKNPEANLAIFAARIARSSFRILSD